MTNKTVNNRAWMVASPNKWVEAIITNPALAKSCTKWHLLTSSEWVNLLQYHPEFACYCKAWDKFDSNQWVALLRKQPEFFGICIGKPPIEVLSSSMHNLSEDPKMYSMLSDIPSVKGDQSLKFSKDDWVVLLRSNMSFAAHCHRVFAGMDFNAFQWMSILEKQPEMYRFIDFEKNKYNEIDIAIMFSKCPALQDKLLQKHNNSWDNITPLAWSYILPNRPDLLKHCQQDKIPTSVWVNIFKNNSQLYFMCDENIRNKISREAFLSLLSAQPTLVYEFCKKYEALNRQELLALSKNDEFMRHYLQAVINIQTVPELQKQIDKTVLESYLNKKDSIKNNTTPVASTKAVNTFTDFIRTQLQKLGVDFDKDKDKDKDKNNDINNIFQPISTPSQPPLHRTLFR